MTLFKIKKFIISRYKSIIIILKDFLNKKSSILNKFDKYQN